MDNRTVTLAFFVSACIALSIILEIIASMKRNRNYNPQPSNQKILRENYLRRLHIALDHIDRCNSIEELDFWEEYVENTQNEIIRTTDMRGFGELLDHIAFELAAKESELQNVGKMRIIK